MSGDTAWQDIYGFRTGRNKNTLTFLKDPTWYAPGVDGVNSLLRAGDADHSRQRRVISHAFSDKALRDQEGLLQNYANLLVSRLKDTVAASSAPVDAVQW